MVLVYSYLLLLSIIAEMIPQIFKTHDYFWVVKINYGPSPHKLFREHFWFFNFGIKKKIYHMGCTYLVSIAFAMSSSWQSFNCHIQISMKLVLRWYDPPYQILMWATSSHYPLAGVWAHCLGFWTWKFIWPNMTQFWFSDLFQFDRKININVLAFSIG